MLAFIASFNKKAQNVRKSIMTMGIEAALIGIMSFNNFSKHTNFCLAKLPLTCLRSCAKSIYIPENSEYGRN